MPMSEYMKELRRKVGQQLLEVTAVSIVARDERDRILLVRHSEQGQWMIPGGAVEPLETPADAALREMWEETGLVVELTRIVGVYGGPEFVVRYGNGDETSYVIVVFEARTVAGQLRPDGVEVLEVQYFGSDEVQHLNMPAWMPEVLQGIFDATHPGFRRPTWTPGLPSNSPEQPRSR